MSYGVIIYRAHGCTLRFICKSYQLEKQLERLLGDPTIDDAWIEGKEKSE